MNPAASLNVYSPIYGHRIASNALPFQIKFFIPHTVEPLRLICVVLRTTAGAGPRIDWQHELRVADDRDQRARDRHSAPLHEGIGQADRSRARPAARSSAGTVLFIAGALPLQSIRQIAAAGRS